MPVFVLPTPFVVAATFIDFRLVVVGGRGRTLRRLVAVDLRRTLPLFVGFCTGLEVAMVPILVIWFGIGVVPAITTAFLTPFLPVVVKVATGLATIEPEAEDVLRALGASKWDG